MAYGILPVTDVPRLMAAITRIHSRIVYWGVRFSDKEVVKVRFLVRELSGQNVRAAWDLAKI